MLGQRVQLRWANVYLAVGPTLAQRCWYDVDPTSNQPFIPTSYGFDQPIISMSYWRWANVEPTIPTFTQTSTEIRQTIPQHLPNHQRAL